MTDGSLSDGEARRLAVDPTRSWLVRAPAGSGKTGLLIQRFLALLARVERPDAVLAITFTRKAAAEMRQRVLDALSDGQCPLPVDAADHQRATHLLAQAVLERNQSQGWNLFDFPDQLQIQTIDSFNASLVAQMPWLSRLGGLPAVSAHPRQLYRQAVRDLVHLSRPSHTLKQGLQQLLHHMDNRSDRLESLLIHLLERRDQWLRHLFSDNVQQRQSLQDALEAVLAEQLVAAAETIPTSVRDEVMTLGDFAAGQLTGETRPLCQLAGERSFPQPTLTAMPVWRGLADLLLTGKGEWRRRCDKTCGFPADKKEPFLTMKNRMKELLAVLEDHDFAALAQVTDLPQGGYSAKQWKTLEALLDVLPPLVAELWLVFRRHGEVDFTEIALKARQSLIDSGQPTEQLLKLDRQIEHILIDEFQDTSWLQFDLLSTLISGWNGQDGRTLFVVGDPMQSIYRFREAEVGLFLQAGQRGVGDVPLSSLQLQANFRSQKGLVEWFNQWFPTIFPEREDRGSGAVCYSMAQPVCPALDNVPVSVFPRLHSAPVEEAREVVDLILKLRERSATQSVAVLVRSRRHLEALLPLLHQHQIPYQAQDIDVLAQRPAISDLVALIRALLHSGDSLSWLTVLRAPWCGLTLTELALFAPQHEDETVLRLMHDDSRLAQLSEPARQRLTSVVGVVDAARRQRGQVSLRQLIEYSWQQLQGSLCYVEPPDEEVEQLLQLLEELDYGGDLLSFEVFTERLSHLFAASPTHEGNPLQIMTIHKAKGLEFDHVILPGLGRKSRGSDQPLMRWLEHPDHGLLLAPITAPGDPPDPIYKLLGRMEQRKETFEVARLLYVAVTRARRHLYLYGHATADKDGQPQPAPGSLLQTLWPAVEQAFSACAAEGEEEVAEPTAATFVRRAEPLPATEARSIESTYSTALSEVHRANLASHVGTVTHDWLERFVRDPGLRSAIGLPQWVGERIRQQLFACGVAEPQLSPAVERVMAMLESTLTSERGRWLLDDHAQSECEYALTGELDGELVQVIIDRTFVIGDERWVVDYKSAQPGALSMEVFYQQQAQQYASQLTRYARLLNRLDPEHTCRCALYFPACDGWYELNQIGDEDV